MTGIRIAIGGSGGRVKKSGIVDIGVTPLLYFDADSLVGTFSEGADVTSLPLLAGASTFTSPGNFPDCALTAWTGSKPCIHFDSSNSELLQSTTAELLSAASGTGASTPALTVVTHMRPLATSVTQTIWSWDVGNTTAELYYAILASTNIWRTNKRNSALTAKNVDATPAGTIIADHALEWAQVAGATSTLEVREDASQLIAAGDIALTGTVAPTFFRIGARNLGAGIADYCSMYLRRLAIYQATLTPTQFNALRTGWATKDA